ncbi:hypothetical protein FIA58_007985 [Flavobacterium jejuense]|uniref:O-antigen ligase n=1 Tax=Flavobacterium jejuense TaxID=1544455 RepID=A0ABX0IUX3_9FLAO|nr:hypothetical protein [Flavobacterium jejuense]NHN25614.1 hypothetical protein [Flavobacterium jejuense]
MRILQNKSNFYSILFFLCIGVSYLNNYELTFMVWTISFLLTIKDKYSLSIIKCILPFAIILLIAFVVSFFYTSSIYLKIRDFTYLFKPILGLLLGYQLLIVNPKEAFKIIVRTGFIIALIHLLLVVKSIFESGAFIVNHIRQVGGYFSDFEVYVIIILIFYKHYNLDYSLKKRNTILLIVSVSCFLYLSRTNFIQFIIFYLALKGYLIFTKKAVKIILISLISTLLAYSVVLYINPKRQGRGLEAFLYKVKIAPIEPFKTKINKEDWRDFNDNYRSYENIITIKQVSNEGLLAVIFGKGLGSNINLGRKIGTNDGTIVQLIPILHNGFITVFLKSGIIGVFFLFFFLFSLYRQRKSSIPIVNYINFLLMGTAVFLIVSNWVFMGLYLKLDNKSIMIGFLLSLRILILKKEEYQNLNE